MTLSGGSAVPRAKVGVRGKRWREGKREGGDGGKEGGRGEGERERAEQSLNA